MGGVVWLIIRNFKKITTIIIDDRGYERDGYGKLVHRKIAYNHLYNYKKHPLKFRRYDIHYIDGNKRNNSPSNLQILTRGEHKAIHRF